MATNFPGSVDNFSNPSGTDSLNSPSHSGQHTNANDAIEAIEGYLLNTYQPSNRNLIINGAMQVAQRGTSTASITTTGYYTADRWNTGNTTMGTWTQSVENDAPTGSGFRKSLKMLCTTADASPAAADRVFVNQLIEGQNLQAIKKGTANAEQLSLSFWVKSNVTGTYIVNFFDADNSRIVSASYSIASSGTWEKKTIVLPADTTGAFDNDNAASLQMIFGLGSGSDRTSGTLNSTWDSFTAANQFVGQTNLAAATNNYWQITGVQLEVGAVATPFEFKPIEQELAECQRYYYRQGGNAVYQLYGTGIAYTTTQVFVNQTLPVSMRVGPTSIDFSTLAVQDGTNVLAVSTVSGSSMGTNHAAFVVGVTGATQWRPYFLCSNNSTSAYIGFSAEL